MKKNPKLRDANDQSHELEDIPDESEDALSDDQSKDKCFR